MSLTRGYGKLRAGAPFDVVKLYGQVTFGATGAVSADSDENGAWTFAKTATGKYTLTTNELYPELLGASFAHFNNGTVTDNAWQIFTEYVPSTGALVLSHLIAGSAAHPVSGNKVNIALEFKVSDL